MRSVHTIFRIEQPSVTTPPPRLPLVKVPTLLSCARSDMFMEYFDKVQELMPDAISIVTPGAGTPQALAETLGKFEAFLDAP